MLNGADRPLVGAHDASAQRFTATGMPGYSSRSVMPKKMTLASSIVLFTLGGSALVGQGIELAPGTFYRSNCIN
jgi:hypothetical protein